MEQKGSAWWAKICIINLLVVALFGVLMRYKIAFEFPFFDQKNLQHAHSHFAFSGWISQLLMVLMVARLQAHHPLLHKGSYNRLLLLHLLVSYGMLLSFTLQGYGPVSILFSTLSVLISGWFCIRFITDSRAANPFAGRQWFVAALLFNVLSAAGTAGLSYMMATHRFDQHLYLAAVYWYLHFQYNGWFFFACAGLFADMLQRHQFPIAGLHRVFLLFVCSAVPAYGLSVLWLPIPLPVYIVIVCGAVLQFIAWLLLLRILIRGNVFKALGLDRTGKHILIFVCLALTTKLALQLGSTVPAISKMAFGFRPVVMAYLHLVLLAFTSVFLLSYLYINKLLVFRKAAQSGLYLFTAAVLLNELMLAAQGIFSFSYTVIPFADIVLLVIGLLLFTGILLLSRASAEAKQRS